MPVEFNRPKAGGSYAQSSFKNFNVTLKMKDVDDDVQSGDDLRIRIYLHRRTPNGWRQVNDGTEGNGHFFSVK